MVIDTSALLSILLPEPDAFRFVELLSEAEERVISTVSYVEAVMILARADHHLAFQRLSKFLRDSLVRIEVFTVEHAQWASEAFLRYGRGRHPARLNYGDCMVYGLAKALGQPILCKGNDFRQTDIRCLP